MRISSFVLAIAACSVCHAAPSRHLHRASTPRFALLATFPIGGPGGWDYINVDPTSHDLYISRGSHVMVMNTTNGGIVGDIPDTTGVHGIVFATKLHKGFTSDGGDNTVTVFDTRTFKVLAKVNVGEGPDGIVYDPASNRVFTANGRSHDVTAIDAKTDAVVGTIKLAGRPEFPSADGKGSVFVNIEDKSLAQQIDSRRLVSVRTWSLAPGESPSGSAADGRHHVFFSTCRNGLLTISDTRTGKVIQTVPIGRGPDAGGFDPRLDLAFSSNGGSGTLTIVSRSSGGTYLAVQNVKTQVSARTMALDPTTHRIYLIAAKFQPASPGESRFRRRIVPGSTVILVVGKTSQSDFRQ